MGEPAAGGLADVVKAVEQEVRVGAGGGDGQVHPEHPREPPAGAARRGRAAEWPPLRVYSGRVLLASTE